MFLYLSEKEYQNGKILKIISATGKYVGNQLKAASYTCRHKRAYLRVERELLGKNTFSGYIHDTNKLVMYLCMVPVKLAHKIHQRLSPHHVKNGKVRNPLHAVIDWESARYTKADKQLTARGVFEKLYPNVEGIKEVLQRFGL